LAQTNLSDLAFMRECARRLNAEIWLDGTTLYGAKRASRGQERVRLAYGANLHECQIRADLAHQCSELSVNGWDPLSKEAIHDTADESAIASELNGLTGGSAILAEAFGERKASLVHTIPLSSDEARAVAEARYRENARRFVTGTGFADGDPRIRVGAILELSQLGQLFDGDYYVVRACHRMGVEHGYQTEFDIERAGIG
jgi:phage protein D